MHIYLLMIYISEGKLKSLLCCSPKLCDTELANRLRREPNFFIFFHISFTFLSYSVSLPSEFGDICEKLSRDTCSTLELIASSASTASMFTRLEDCNKGRTCVLRHILKSFYFALVSCPTRLSSLFQHLVCGDIYGKPRSDFFQIFPFC